MQVVTKLVTDIKVKPYDWLVNSASVKQPWQIWYRYNGTLIKVMGMNREKNYKNRVELTKELIQQEEKKLFVYGYNPISKLYLRPPVETSQSHPSIVPTEDMGLTQALQYAFTLLDVDHKTLLCVRSCLKYVYMCIQELRFQLIPVRQIQKKHIKLLMNHCKEKRQLSSRSWNAYRSYLMMLFDALEEMEIVDFDPVKTLKKKKEDIKQRDTLSASERELVKAHLLEHYPDFYRFVQIFFHSGGRRTELLALKVKDVNLTLGEYRTIVKKGERRRHVIRVIKNLALPFWKEQLTAAQPEDFVFSVGLIAGPLRIREEQVTRRWRRLVKDKLGVTADLYSLKHLNTDETAGLLDIEAAAAHNSHTTSTITTKYYAYGEEERMRTRIRAVNNEL